MKARNLTTLATAAALSMGLTACGSQPNTPNVSIGGQTDVVDNNNSTTPENNAPVVEGPQLPEIVKSRIARGVAATTAEENAGTQAQEEFGSLVLNVMADRGIDTTNFVVDSASNVKISGDNAAQCVTGSFATGQSNTITDRFRDEVVEATVSENVVVCASSDGDIVAASHDVATGNENLTVVLSDGDAANLAISGDVCTPSVADGAANVGGSVDNFDEVPGNVCEAEVDGFLAKVEEVFAN